MSDRQYTTQLQAGLGMCREMRLMLDLWHNGMNATRLYDAVLQSGRFPNISARRLRNVVAECFGPRLLCDNARPAILLKNLFSILIPREFDQLLFIFTCRANAILNDFVRTVYWQYYSAGRDSITNADAKSFVVHAHQDGKTKRPWSETSIRRVSGYLTGCCADFELLERGSKPNRKILTFRIEPRVATILAYDLHFRGLGDNSVIGHEDWSLFGLDRADVLAELKRVALKGLFIIQSAGDASMAFVGNIDYSIAQLVNSTKHDLFMPLPPELDFAVMDRFACYMPGWEMPKNSSGFLTTNYGLITDFLAEAFHYQFAHSNRYEEVTKRVKLGTAIEGRDEKGIKKTICAFLKILHPDGPPVDAEFEEYVAYAVECRRRVKEQMNKRKPDDEFAKIDLSYFNKDGKEVVVYCPESKDAVATQNPTRSTLTITAQPAPAATSTAPTAVKVAVEVIPEKNPEPVQVAAIEPESLKEQHFTIMYGETGHSYESLIGPYLEGATEILIEDAYIRQPHQIQNFVRVCEAIVKHATVKKIKLVTYYDDTLTPCEPKVRLAEVKQSLLELDIELEIEINPKLHDREIRINNGWIIKIGRGLDFFQKPLSWFEVGANDLSLRKCLETKVDIFRA